MPLDRRERRRDAYARRDEEQIIAVGGVRGVGGRERALDPDWARRRPLDRVVERPRPVPGGRDAEADPFLAGRGAVRREGVPLRPREPRDQHVHVALHAVVPPLWFLKRDLDAGTEPLEDGVLDAQRAVAERVERVGAVDGERCARDGRAHTRVWHTTATVPEMPSSTCTAFRISNDTRARARAVTSTRTGAQQHIAARPLRPAPPPSLARSSRRISHLAK